MKHRMLTGARLTPIFMGVARLRPWITGAVFACASTTAVAAGTQTVAQTVAQAAPQPDSKTDNAPATAVNTGGMTVQPQTVSPRSEPTQAAPSATPSQVGKLTLDQQVRWLRQAQETAALEKLDDAQLTALFQSLDPLAVSRLIKDGPNGYPSYEFTMLRWERIKGAWPDHPDHMAGRIAHDPLRIYAKWLPDGAHAGQEIIYDESKRADEMYGHLGGVLGVVPIWTSTTGALAHAQSNHEVRDLGIEYIASQYLSEGKKYVEAGVPRSTQIGVQTINGVRVVTFTYETPIGQPQFYAKKETLGLDLRHPYFRTVESYNNDGKIFEKIVFESVTPKTLDETAFDPKNPDYRF